MKRYFPFFIVGLLLASFVVGSSFHAGSLFESALAKPITTSFPITRGEGISLIVDAFDLQNREKDYLQECLDHIDECFLVFGARSHFHRISYQPLLLYPDVTEGYRYYDAVNVATMLDLVQGYPDQKESPFRPRSVMSKMQALKVLLGAGNFLNWKERFELTQELGGEDGLRNQRTPFTDVSGNVDHMWWYPRYVNHALEKGILAKGERFSPDEPISREELSTWLQKAVSSL